MTENNFSFTPMANEDISIHIGSVPGAAAESGAPVASASPVSAQQPEAESIFGEIPAVPTQEAVDGILFDFNDGIRILFPQNQKEYHVVFSDSDTGVILFSQDTVPGAFITSVKKFYICFQLAIYEKGGKEPLFTHDFDARDKEVMIQIPVGTLGDSIGWFSYVERFQRKHRCRLICVMNQWIIDIVKNQYPDIVFITPAQTKNYKPYACYHMGLFFRGDVDHQPIDFRYIGLHRTAGFVLSCGKMV